MNSALTPESCISTQSSRKITDIARLPQMLQRTAPMITSNKQTGQPAKGSWLSIPAHWVLHMCLLCQLRQSILVQNLAQGLYIPPLTDTMSNIKHPAVQESSVHRSTRHGCQPTAWVPLVRLVVVFKVLGCACVQEQHKNSKVSPRQRELVSLCQLPFVLNPEAKARIMQGEALLQKQHQAQALTLQVRPNTHWAQ